MVHHVNPCLAIVLRPSETHGLKKRLKNFVQNFATYLTFYLYSMIQHENGNRPI